MTRGLAGGIFLLVAATAPAHALCSYGGVDGAKTTIAQEFKDSRWVARVHLVSADYHWSDDGDAWVSYRLKPVERFKGRLPAEFSFFSERDSGGFYMDVDGANPDFDHDYLLFLVPYPKSRSNPRAARGALWVNYNCGKSKSWSEVTPAETAELRRLRAGAE